MSEGPHDVPARVVGEHRGVHVLQAPEGELLASLAGRLRHDSRGPADLPAVGDDVIARVEGPGTAVIHTVLPRRSVLRRRETGRQDGQILAVNVDEAFIVIPLHRDLTPLEGRIQQYVALVRDSGAEPVLLLTKADLCPDVSAQVSRAARAAPGVAVVVTSSVSGDGLAIVARRLAPGRTAVLLGPSGAGKSSLLNALCGRAVLRTRELTGLGEGRHASVRRELLALPGGGALIDTPGLRQVDAWLSEGAVEAAYPDVAALAPACRFRDCTHAMEPGCAVRGAIAAGRLDPLRLAAMRTLQDAAARQDRTALERRRARRDIGRASQPAPKARRGDGGRPDP